MLDDGVLGPLELVLKLRLIEQAGHITDEEV